jgi:dienelactone hydrolase
MIRTLFCLCCIVAVTACSDSAAPAQSLQTFAYDRSAALDVQESPPSQVGPVNLSTISFISPGGGRVTGVLAVPLAAGPHAGVVLLHGLPGTAQGAMNGEGLGLAARGAVVLAIDAPWVRRGGFPDFTVRDSVEQVQLMQDLQRAVDVLLARSDVDRARLAYVGGSYGGAMGSLFAGIERRLKAFVLMVPDGGLVAHYTNQDGSPSGYLATLPPATAERWLAAMRPIEPILFIPQATAPLLFQSGRQDQLVAEADAEALHLAAPQPKTIQWYEAGHGLTLAAKTARLAWLASQIGTSP